MKQKDAFKILKQGCNVLLTGPALTTTVDMSMQDLFKDGQRAIATVGTRVDRHRIGMATQIEAGNIFR